jgi:hypothetical protein
MSLIISNRDALVAHAAGCLAARQAQAPAPRLRLGNISGLDFSGLNLEGLTLLAPFLAGGYNISRCKFRGSNLRGARLTFHDLTGVDFTEADLTGATLFGADLRRATMAGAKVAEGVVHATAPLLASFETRENDEMWHAYALTDGRVILTLGNERQPLEWWLANVKAWAKARAYADWQFRQKVEPAIRKAQELAAEVARG